ncbi:uncharacterized protein LOC115959465 [Quercus lobata]|uniref:uncharacterized protein LOC115959465 n=1 Tax=Quercus lobata TaxID=97700 RepID=UPI0012473612|nr:uncharacterized protein LOC115959465 [Quercus lobata]
MPHVTSEDAISKALHQISQSPFSKEIEKTDLPKRFTRPTFTIYDGKMDPMEYVSHYNQSMAIYSKNEALMCKNFPSSLGPTAMRWFDRLEKGVIRGFDELIRAFGARGIATSTFKVGLPIDFDLRASLALKPVTDMNKLMERVEEYKRLEDDQLQDKAKAKVPVEEKKEVKAD